MDSKMRVVSVITTSIAFILILIVLVLLKVVKTSTLIIGSCFLVFMAIVIIQRSKHSVPYAQPLTKSEEKDHDFIATMHLYFAENPFHREQWVRAREKLVFDKNFKGISVLTADYYMLAQAKTNWTKKKGVIDTKNIYSDVKRSLLGEIATSGNKEDFINEINDDSARRITVMVKSQVF